MLRTFAGILIINSEYYMNKHSDFNEVHVNINGSLKRSFFGENRQKAFKLVRWQIHDFVSTCNDDTKVYDVQSELSWQKLY